MSDLVGNPEDRFSHNEARVILMNAKDGVSYDIVLVDDRTRLANQIVIESFYLRLF